MKEIKKSETKTPPSEAYFSTEDNEFFFPKETHKKTARLPPGVYKVFNNPVAGIFFGKQDYSQTDLLKFDDSIIMRAVEGIQSFWKKRELFKTHNFPFRRGMLLYGPPGSGKTCAVKMIINNIIDSNGIVLVYQNVNLLQSGINAIRKIQPDVPIVVVMEDLDSILDYDDSSQLLNMLDGIGGYENIVYLATTNYINRLEGRIKNRPSRFDIRYLISFPNEKSRKMYLEYISKNYKQKLPLNKWARDTEGFSIAHLKEMYLSLVFFENDYDKTLNRLKQMSSDKDYDSEDDNIDDGHCGNPDCGTCNDDPEEEQYSANPIGMASPKAN